MEYDYSVILNRLLGRVDSSYDKREGSIIYMMLAPVALEFAQAYANLLQIQDDAYADTASMYWLEKRAKERNFYPTEATAAVMKGKFNIEVDNQTLFTGINTELNYTVGEEITGINDGYYYYEMICTETGEAGHSYIGNIVPVNGDIEGLSLAEITETIVRGADKETVEHFRERYFDSFINQSFGGNIAEYKEKMKEVSADVGGVKVYPLWLTNESEIVIVFTNAENEKPDNSLVAFCQNEICPTPYTGVGIAPIGHNVIIEGVNYTDISIGLTLTYATGYSWDDVYEAIENVINTYISELNAEWENVDNIIIRISQIESKVLTITGIIDVTDTTINNSQSNLTLNANNIARVVDISENE